MHYETMEAQELLPRKLLHKPNNINSGFFYTVKATVKLKFKFLKSNIHKGLQSPETIEWE